FAFLDSGATDTVYHQLFFTGVNSLGPHTSGFMDNILTWKIWHGLTAGRGTTFVTHTGDQGSQSPLPALQIKNLGTAKSAINTFALGDMFSQGSLPPAHDWDVRYDWLRAIYRNHFGMVPTIDLTGPGANYVISDYRLCSGGGILISLLNGYTNTATATLTSHTLLDGKIVENLTT